MVGTLDKEVIEKFLEFQEKTGKHSELYIEDVELEDIPLSNAKYFQFVKGKNKYIQRYIKANQGEYPILGSSLKNSCISAYIKEIDKSDIITQPSVTFNKDNAKGSVPFFRDYPFLMDRHHIAIIPTSTLVDAKYLEKSLIRFFEKSKFAWGDNIADVEAVQRHSIPIPKDLNKFYPSIKIQEAIVEFLEYSFTRIERIRENVDTRYKLFERLEKALIPSVFIKDYAKIAFGRYAKEHNIDFNITDVDFKIKRIYSDKKNDPEVICEKRMGFTPKTDILGDINWFRVEDLNANNGLFINNPNTIKKTTIAQVIAKNGKKSSKNLSIKKGDILVSFLATPGIVKIYNSDKVAYCNQAIDILTTNPNIVDNRYIAYNCQIEYPKYGKEQTMGLNLNDEDKKKIKIYIPNNLENYKSLEIQKIIADFIEYTQNRIQKEFDEMDKVYDALNRLHKIYLARTFSLIDWGAK